MTCHDWRDAPAHEIAGLYEAERQRWLTALHWDLAPSWAIVEEARAAGRLPGRLVRDVRGRIAGWSFFLVHNNILQIGALAGDRAGAIRVVLDATLNSPEASRARQYSTFLFPGAPACVAALQRRRFELRWHLHMERALTDADLSAACPHDDLETSSGAPRIRAWSGDEAPGAVRLLARSYAGERAASCFAPNGRPEEWAHYVAQLVRTAACGVFAPDASFVARDAADSAAVILTTRVADDTAHVAQIAVDGSMRCRGVGAALVRLALAAARAHGERRMTLLVEESAVAARALYAKLGFVETSAFVFASRPRPTMGRLSSGALRSSLSSRAATSSAALVAAR